MFDGLLQRQQAGMPLVHVEALYAVITERAQDAHTAYAEDNLLA